MRTLGAANLLLWMGVAMAVGLGGACGDDDSSAEEEDPGDDPFGNRAGSGGARAGSSAAGTGGRAGSRAGAGGAGGAAGSSGRGGSSGEAGASGGSGTGPVRDLGYVGCPDFFGCACLIGGDRADPWHVCAPPCGPSMTACAAPDEGNARAECKLQPVSMLGRRFPTDVDGACVLHCDGGLDCPDGLTCMAGGQGTQLCVEPGVVPYPAMLAPATEPDEAPTLAMPLGPLCGARTMEISGELSDDDPVFRRGAQDASGCMLAPDGRLYHYDLYAYELVGDGPHELTAHTCGSPATFDTVIDVYQDRTGSAGPLDIANACPHLLAVADDSVYCDDDGASLVRMTGLAEGVVHILVTSFDPDVTGTYQLSVESPTSTCP